jgi:hypothetical protein
VSTFTAFDQTKPTTAQTRQAAIDSVRNDEFALLAFALLNGLAVPGWAYTNSVTRGLGSPGTAAQPAKVFMTTGSGGTTQWVRGDLTYDGTTGAVTKIAFYYSSDNEGTYAQLGDGTNYVCHLSYDGSGNLTSTSWDATP